MSKFEVNKIRIPSLRAFYKSGNVAPSVPVEAEISTSRKLSDDVVGQHSTEMFRAAAVDLAVLQFILPLDRGGESLPVIADQEEYVEAFTAEVKAEVDALESGCELREDYVAEARDVVKECKEVLEEWKRMVIADAPAVVDKTADAHLFKAYERALAEHEQLLMDRDTGYTAARDMYDRKFAMWQSAESQLKKDRARMKELVSDAVSKGEKRFNEDTDALARAVLCIRTLKTFLTGMVNKHSSLFETVTNMGDGAVDPYAAGDMRAVYANLVERFQNGDSMGVCTTLLGCVREAQHADQSLSDFLRIAGEEFVQVMARLKVTSISIMDLAAIVVIGGMLPSHRQEFLRIETQLSLTQGDAAEEEEMECSSDAGTTVAGSGKKAPIKSLYGKVRAFCKKDAEMNLIGSRLSGSGGGGGTVVRPPRDRALEEQRRRVREANSVLSAMESDRKAQTEDVKKTGVCRQWRDHGKCDYGDQCKFVHVTQAGQQPVAVPGKHFVAAGGKLPAPVMPFTAPAKASRVLYALRQDSPSDSEEDDDGM